MTYLCVISSQGILNVLYYNVIDEYANRINILTKIPILAARRIQL
jgi:hypothetical protein